MKNKTTAVIMIFISLMACNNKTSYTLKWKTASEFQNFGYDIYRSEHPQGPFQRINSTPILGAGTTDTINSYSYTDKQLIDSKNYYYYIESISELGKRKQFSPIKPVLSDE